MQEVGGELVLTLLQILLRHARLLEDGDVEGELLALQHVGVEEVDNLARVLPGPSTQDPGTINGVLTHVVIEERVEVKVRHSAHRSLQPFHLN